jgi:hypothetical protein
MRLKNWSNTVVPPSPLPNSTWPSCAGSRRTRHQIPPLAALPSADLRQGGALPPDPQKTPAGATRRHDHRRAATPDQRIPGLLQRRSPAPGATTPHPIEAFTDRPKAFPTGCHIPRHYRVRHEKIDAAESSPSATTAACTTSGQASDDAATVIVLIDDLDNRVLDRDTGTLIRKLVLDPTRDYQPRRVKCGNAPENRLPV